MPKASHDKCPKCKSSDVNYVRGGKCVCQKCKHSFSVRESLSPVDFNKLIEGDGQPGFDVPVSAEGAVAYRIDEARGVIVFKSGEMVFMDNAVGDAFLVSPSGDSKPLLLLGREVDADRWKQYQSVIDLVLDTQEWASLPEAPAEVMARQPEEFSDDELRLPSDGRIG